MNSKLKLLYITDLHYKAKGRTYHEEDIYLSNQLSKYFDLVLCHPLSAIPFMSCVDGIISRNTGPIMYYREEYESFCKKAVKIGIKVFNELTGKADMQGKQYLVDLTNTGFPVVPTIDCQKEIKRLPETERYVKKLKDGGDSIGREIVKSAELENIDFKNILVQPVMNFIYEVSFYFINHEFQYALYAPKTEHRWELENYDASEEDLYFASKFIKWNEINHGIQRVDACRMPSGDLFLMELEDVNPYLSLHCLSEKVRDKFVINLISALISYF